MKDKNTEKIKEMKKVERAAKTKKTKKDRTGNVSLQKRFVSAVKVFLTDAEKEAIREKVGNFNSLSNYIRHHLGLPINTVGRKKIHTESALDLDLDELEKPEKAKTTGKMKSVKTAKNLTLLPEDTSKPPVEISKPSEVSKKRKRKGIIACNEQLGLWDERF